MPPLPVVTNGLQIVIQGTAPSSQNWENVFGYEDTGGAINQETADVFAGKFHDFYEAVLTSDQYSADKLILTDLRTLDGPQFENTADIDVAGASAGQPLPLQTAALVSWTTSRRSRAGRGRTYLCGFTEADSDAAHIESAKHTAISDAVAQLLTDLPGLAVMSRYHSDGGDPPVTVPRDPGIVTVITGYVVHDLWKTQRRRAPRG